MYKPSLKFTALDILPKKLISVGVYLNTWLCSNIFLLKQHYDFYNSIFLTTYKLTTYKISSNLLMNSVIVEVQIRLGSIM